MLSDLKTGIDLVEGIISLVSDVKKSRSEEFTKLIQEGHNKFMDEAIKFIEELENLKIQVSRCKSLDQLKELEIETKRTGVISRINRDKSLAEYDVLADEAIKRELSVRHESFFDYILSIMTFLTMTLIDDNFLERSLEIHERLGPEIEDQEFALGALKELSIGLIDAASIPLQELIPEIQGNYATISMEFDQIFKALKKRR